jgi:hypothetical protein
VIVINGMKRSRVFNIGGMLTAASLGLIAAGQRQILITVRDRLVSITDSADTSGTTHTFVLKGNNGGTVSLSVPDASDVSVSTSDTLQPTNDASAAYSSPSTSLGTYGDTFGYRTYVNQYQQSVDQSYGSYPPASYSSSSSVLPAWCCELKNPERCYRCGGASSSYSSFPFFSSSSSPSYQPLYGYSSSRSAAIPNVPVYDPATGQYQNVNSSSSSATYTIVYNTATGHYEYRTLGGSTQYNGTGIPTPVYDPAPAGSSSSAPVVTYPASGNASSVDNNTVGSALDPGLGGTCGNGVVLPSLPRGNQPVTTCILKNPFPPVFGDSLNDW